jgi:hypothetical protein
MNESSGEKIKFESTPDRFKPALTKYNSQVSERLKLNETTVLDFVDQAKTLHQHGGQITKPDGKVVIVQPPEKSLPAHNWENHIEKDLVMFLALLPQVFQEHPELEFTQQHIHLALQALSLHDLAWLLNSEDEDIYHQPEEKFFIHCQQSQQLAEWLMLSQDYSQQEAEVVAKLIGYTEFNFPPDISGLSPELQALGRLIQAADQLSYVCSPDQIPDGVMALYTEAQAMANPKCELTRRYFYPHIKDTIDNVAGQTLEDQIAKSLNIRADQVEDWFELGLLTIADLRFPGQTVFEFATSSYLATQREKYQSYLNYLEEKRSDLSANCHNNLFMIDQLKELQGTGAVNPLVYFEGSFNKLELRRWLWRLKEHQLINNHQFEQIDKAWVEDIVPEKGDVFSRLVTSDIIVVLNLIAAEDRPQALKLLIKKYLRRQQVSKTDNQDEIYLAIAPQAYQSGRKTLLTSRQIFTALTETNKERLPAEPIVRPVFTIRRDQDDWLTDDYFDQLVGSKDQLAGVVLGGREEQELTDSQIDRLSKLADEFEDKKVLIQVGQVSVDQEEIAVANLKKLINLAKKHDNIYLVGLQRGLTGLEEEWTDLNQLADQGRVIAMISSDLATIYPDKKIEEHPILTLSRVTVASTHGVASEPILEAGRLARIKHKSPDHFLLNKSN